MVTINTQENQGEEEQNAPQTSEDVILNSGSSFQTVTIVPSEVNQSGEVSYVLIVSQPEDTKGEKGDMSDLSKSGKRIEDTL